MTKLGPQRDSSPSWYFWAAGSHYAGSGSSSGTGRGGLRETVGDLAGQVGLKGTVVDTFFILADQKMACRKLFSQGCRGEVFQWDMMTSHP